MSKLHLALTLSSRLLLFAFIFFISFFITAVLSFVITLKFGLSTPAIRIVTIIQDVMFIVPPVLTAVMVTRQPASLLCIDRAPNLKMLLVAVCALLASIPAMDYVIYLNQNIALPSTWERWFTALEQNASGTIDAMCGGHTAADLIMSLLIIGVMAGVSEELLFRGGLQRLMVTGGVNHHAAIWITAAVFSIIHLQFYGFVPRMLLGAFFGYLLYWTRSLWIPVLMHVINNSVYILSEWLGHGDGQTAEAPQGISGYLWIAVSAAVTALALYAVVKVSSSVERSRQDARLADE